VTLLAAVRALGHNDQESTHPDPAADESRMAIKFSCPNCGKALSVKDQLAGKRGACSGCKKVITIPFPLAAPHHEDVEALAREAFADEPAAAPVEDSRTIDFTCPMCDEPIKVGYDLGGKQTPCPSCRRIIKVPMPVKNEPKDWRKVQARGPSMAKRDTEPAPEGAWGSTTSTGSVSRETLLETGAIVEEIDEDAGRQRLERISLIGAIVVAVAMTGLLVMRFVGGGKSDDLMARAVATASAESSPLSPEQAAVVYWAAGEYQLRSGAPDAAQKAAEQFQFARGALAWTNSLERDVMLGEFAAAIIDSGGDKAEADKGTALEWSKALEGARQAIEQIHTPEARLDAVRLVTRKLIAKGQARAAHSLAGRLGGSASTRPGGGNANAELLAVVALELFRAGNQKEAQTLADSLSPAKPPAKGAPAKAPPVTPALVALAVVLDRAKPEIRKTGKPGEEKEDSEDLENTLLGVVEGLALKKEHAQARQLLSGVPPLVRFKGFVVLTSLADSPGESPDLVAALDLAESDARTAIAPTWSFFRLVQLAVQAGQLDRAKRLINLIPDQGLKAQAHVAILREQLRGNKEKIDLAEIDEIPEKTGARAKALELVVRHDVQLDRGAVKSVERLDESRRAPALAGAALGMQDSGR
jgi:hypothetical protein